MRSLRELLDGFDLPGVAGARAVEYRMPCAALLGGDLPPGHLHVWCGPPGAGKTAFLLGLLHDAARHGRTSLLATYDLSAPAVALRLLAMTSGVAVHDLETRVLSGDSAAAVASARARLSALPLHVLEARGLGVASLDDRVVRSPSRVEVLGIDVLEAVAHGPADAPVVQDLADLASRRFVSVVCASRAGVAGRADRVGLLAPDARRGSVEATVVENRHGARVAHLYSVDERAARLIDAP